jgi:hypothetical protein
VPEENVCGFRGKTNTRFGANRTLMSTGLNVGEPGCSRTRARVWSSQAVDPYTRRHVLFVRSAGRSRASTAHAAAVTLRVWDVTRVAIDIDLDQPIVLAVKMSVHVCATCTRMFRAQPAFLRPRGIYTGRVVRKAIDAVHATVWPRAAFRIGLRVTFG